MSYSAACPSWLFSQSTGTSEYEVKAGFLYNFAKFVQWPPDAFHDESGPITLCIFGRDPFGDALDNIVRGKIIGGRSFSIRRTNKLDALKNCQLIFMSTDEAVRLKEML
jgi:hypothetical protein